MGTAAVGPALVSWIRAPAFNAALRTITEGAEARRYGIELDAYRAAEAKKILDEVIHGSVFETHSPVESYTMLYLNPPYSHEIGEGKNQRLEQVFLEHTFRWLKPGGVLVLIVPFDRVNDCRGVLTPQFRDKTIPPAAAGVAFLAQLPQIAWAILAIVLINGAFNFWQEYRASQLVAALRKEIPRAARVLRDGMQHRVPAREIVPGDVPGAPRW